MHDPKVLADAELLAVLLHSRVEWKNAIELGRESLLRFGSLQEMMAAAIFARAGIRGLSTTEVAQLMAALAIGFYEIHYASKKRSRSKRAEFRPDFFIKFGVLIQVIEMKGDEKLNKPSQGNITKSKYAMARFTKLNEHREEKGSPVSYRFNFLSPIRFNRFSQEMRNGNLQASHQSWISGCEKKEVVFPTRL